MFISDRIHGSGKITVSADMKVIKQFYIRSLNETHQDPKWLEDDLVLRNGGDNFELSGKFYSFFTFMFYWPTLVNTLQTRHALEIGYLKWTGYGHRQSTKDAAKKQHEWQNRTAHFDKKHTQGNNIYNLLKSKRRRITHKVSLSYLKQFLKKIYHYNKILCTKFR